MRDFKYDFNYFSDNTAKRYIVSVRQAIRTACTSHLYIFLQTVFDPMYISVYNLFYTSLPVLAVGIFDQDVNDKNSLMYPKLYAPGLQNLLFNKKEFCWSALHGFYASCVLFLVPYGKYPTFNC